MKVVVLGANGQLGCDVCSAFSGDNHEVVPLNHDEIKIEDFQDVISQLDSLRPDTVINTAAKHNVDECEEDPLDALAVNGIGARNLAIASNQSGFKFIHISTDYVFDGLKNDPYVETDLPIPVNAYGNSKLCGENFIRTISKKYFIVRTSALYGTNPCRAKGGMNFIRLMLHLAEQRDELKVVDDETVSPTFTQDLAKQILVLTKTQDYGLYHATAQGYCTWYQFAKEIFNLVNKKTKVIKASSSEFPKKTPRPAYSVLDNQNLRRQGLDIMPDWRDALRRYMELLNVHMENETGDI